MPAVLKKDKPTFKVETIEETPPAVAETPTAPVAQATTETPEQTPVTTEPTATEPAIGESAVVEEESPKSINKSSIFLFIGGFLLGGAIVGGIFWYKNGVEEPVAEAVLTPTPTATETATPTPTVVEIDYSKFAVNILNGSGTPGEAGAVQALLEVADFIDFETGNASAYNFEETEVAIKESVNSIVFDTIKEALAKYEVKQVKDLASTSDYDIVITVGSSKTKTSE